MRVVSLNAWGGKVWDALAAWVPEVGADVLCLQEVTRAPVASPDWLIYRDPERQLDQRADLFRDVSRLLPSHQGYFAAAARGMLEDAGGKPFPSEHGLAMWVARELSVAGLVQRFVHGRFRPDGWGLAPVPRTFQAMRLVEANGGRGVTVAHFHGLRDPAGKGDTPARAAQARAAVAALAEVRLPGEGAILAGDFNLLPGSDSFGIFAGAGLDDLIARHGIVDTRTSLYPKPERFADYMLVSPEIAVGGFEVPADPEVSDHRPLILDF